jgi:hypothetical protein
MALDEDTVYMRWESPSRLFKKRDKDFFRNILAIVALILVILFFAREFILILAVLSVVFLIYVFSTVPPENIAHAITSLGIETSGKFYPWDSMSEFWFEKQWDQHMLVITPKMGTRLIILLGDVEEEGVKDVLKRHLLFSEIPKKTMVDNAATWLSKKIPLEKTS